MQRSAFMVTVVPLVAIAGIVYEFAHPPWTALRIAGLIVMTIALILLTVSRIQLGNSFSLTPQAKKLVTHGIYSRIRNPTFSGLSYLRDCFFSSIGPGYSCLWCP